MSLLYLLDSDVFSLMVSGRDAAINERMRTLGEGQAMLSVVTTGEFFYGATHQPISELCNQRAQRLIDFFGVLSLDAQVAQTYGAIRAELRAKGMPIGPNELWLAAQARHMAWSWSRAMAGNSSG